MTLRTGKGSQYRYDTCSTKARQGEAGCSGLTVPMDKLAKAVDEWRLLDPQRLTVMMDQVLERRQEWNDRRRGHIAELRKRVAEAEAKLKRLHEAIENGIITATDPSLEDRIAELSAIRDQAHAMPTVPLRRWSARRKLRNEDGTSRRDICVLWPGASRSSVRARFASSARKPNCCGHLSPPLA